MTEQRQIRFKLKNHKLKSYSFLSSSYMASGTGTDLTEMDRQKRTQGNICGQIAALQIAATWKQDMP